MPVYLGALVARQLVFTLTIGHSHGSNGRVRRKTVQQTVERVLEGVGVGEWGGKEGRELRVPSQQRKLHGQFNSRGGRRRR